MPEPRLLWGFALLVALFFGLRWSVARLRLSLAKPRSLAGHARIASRVARWIPDFAYGPERAFRVDGAPLEIAEARRAAFDRLGRELEDAAPETLRASRALQDRLSDARFVESYRVPFPFRELVRRGLPVGVMRDASEGPRVRDLDGRWSLDLTGSYGVNLLGHEAYKRCIERGAERVRELGPLLGPYHPIVLDNVERLAAISGLDEVSFHMSGTEAVMQAVRLARYHTNRSHLVLFSGSYHGWWDGVQPGVGNRRRARDVYTLQEGSRTTLEVLRTRRDIACVLVNPLQALHRNSSAPSDATLLFSGRRAAFDREAYAAWLRDLRAVCTERGIALIFDEVFLGFRAPTRWPSA